MKTFSRSLLLCLSASLLLLAGACHPTARHSTATLLDDVESYINDHPDSALAVLRGLDSTAVRGRTLRARYSLLHTMALDKCYEDITVPGLLDDATAWFSRHGSPDDRMKTYYYQGRIQQDKGNLNEAAIAYSQAEGFAEKASDAHAKGLLYLAFGSVYNAVYNYQQELQQKQKGLSILQEANDPLYDAACGELALVYHSLQEWNAADSLYRKAIENAKNSHAKALFLSNYARMKLLRPEKDPAGAIELLDLKRTETSSPLTLQEASVYAYASDLLGDSKTADTLLQQIERLPKAQQVTVLAMLSRIALHRNDFEKAYDYLHEADLYQMEKVKATLEDSVSQTLKDYYDNQASQERFIKERVVRTALICFLMLTIVILLLLIRKQRLETERDRLLGIHTELLSELQTQEHQFTEQKVQNAALEKKLEQVRSTLTAERIDRLRNAGKVGYQFWMGQNRRLGTAQIINNLKKEFRYIYNLETDLTELKKRLDHELDGLVSQLTKDLKISSQPKEVQFLCFWIIGLKPDMIAEISGLQANNVYVKKHRLEERIHKLNKSEYQILLRSLS